MYDEKLEKLIDLALADGNLSEKERDVLRKKASEFGVDQDELEMVIEARLFLLTTKTNNKQSEEVSNLEDERHDKSQIEILLTNLKKIDTDYSQNKPSGFLGNIINKRESNYTKMISEKKELIQCFSSLKTKKHILSFLELGVENSIKKGNFAKGNPEENKIHNDLSSTWKMKFEEIQRQSRVKFQDDIEFINSMNILEKKVDSIS
ncbi:MAG: hypothetical protein RLZZ198_711 [Bacteroidota bacterium]|jgi:hypothetical protein